MHKNLDYLLDVTNQLLDFQKVESGALILNKRECDIKDLLNDVFSQFAGYAKLKGLKLELSLCEQEVVSLIDREKVNKILVNLMGNAMKYARRKIELKLESTPSDFEILVCDDGPGVPDSEKEKIFETFYQLHDDKIAATMGTGIGLSFAKLLAEAHHGTLKIADNTGGGSMFILSLLIEKSKKKEEQLVKTTIATKKVPQTDEAVLQNRKKFTILLTEDNIELLNMTYDSLRQWYRVLKAHNGREALDVLNQEDVDVIVSDVMMPEIDGLELCNKVKSDINYSHIPVILLTAKTALESKVEGMESGADAYIEKPFSIRQVHLQIENLLRLRQAFHRLMTSLQDSNDSSSAIADYGLTQKDYKFTTKLQQLLSERLADESFSVDTLADQLNMSRSSFYRKIKALSGMSPNDYMKAVRMNKAAELIRQGERISEVAEQVGFTSSSYFAKCFKAQFGVLPKDYLSS
jgi:DNA-binding response OmpR family regulator